jgi:hypothetical protein
MVGFSTYCFLLGRHRRLATSLRGLQIRFKVLAHCINHTQISARYHPKTTSTSCAPKDPRNQIETSQIAPNKKRSTETTGFSFRKRDSDGGNRKVRAADQRRDRTYHFAGGELGVPNGRRRRRGGVGRRRVALGGGEVVL